MIAMGFKRLLSTKMLNSYFQSNSVRGEIWGSAVCLLKAGKGLREPLPCSSLLVNISNVIVSLTIWLPYLLLGILVFVFLLIEV